MWIDAHNHLHELTATHGDSLITELQNCGVTTAIVNGTSPEDWPAVADLADRHSWIIPAFGLHPWRVANAPSDWRSRLISCLGQHLGEIGLDKCRPHFDQQRVIFQEQLSLAAKNQLHASIHCVQAWGPLLTDISARPLPPFILHAYSGSVEMVNSFASAGAYFSFSGSFLHAHRSKTQDIFRHIPLDRVLVETDAPFMPLPDSRVTNRLPDPDLNHPANLIAVYKGLAEVLQIQTEELREQVAENFREAFPPG